MASTDSTATEHRCLGCGRRITSAESIAMGRGSGCRAKLRRAAKTADLSAWTARQAEQAAELISDGGIVPAGRPGVFQTVSTDGSEVYVTTTESCECPAGLRDKPCYHRAAVTIILAATNPAPRRLALAA